MESAVDKAELVIHKHNFKYLHCRYSEYERGILYHFIGTKDIHKQNALSHPKLLLRDEILKYIWREVVMHAEKEPETEKNTKHHYCITKKGWKLLDDLREPKKIVN